MNFKFIIAKRRKKIWLTIHQPPPRALTFVINYNIESEFHHFVGQHLGILLNLRHFISAGSWKKYCSHSAPRRLLLGNFTQPVSKHLQHSTFYQPTMKLNGKFMNKFREAFGPEWLKLLVVTHLLWEYATVQWKESVWSNKTSHKTLFVDLLSGVRVKDECFWYHVEKNAVWLTKFIGGTISEADNCLEIGRNIAMELTRFNVHSIEG